MFLDAKELEELTGLKLGKCQARWLKNRGYVFELSRYGKPKVLRSYLEQRMGLATGNGNAQTEPDFSRWKEPQAA
jgi:hypothetical protein